MGSDQYEIEEAFELKRAGGHALRDVFLLKESCSQERSVRRR